MTELEESIAKMRGVRARLTRDLERRPQRLLEPAKLKAARFMPGDRVRDKNTGEVYDVVTSNFEAFLNPTP